MSTTMTVSSPLSEQLTTPTSKATTFNDFSRHPPIEDFKTIDGLLKSHAAHEDQKPLICYPSNDICDFEEHTAAAIEEYTNLAVQFYLQNGLQPADPTKENAPVVAILSPSCFEVIVTIFALNRLGWALLFLSTRLTPPAYARLLGMADCSTIIVPNENRAIVSEICKDRPGCKGISTLKREDYRGHAAVPAFQRHGVDLSIEAKKMAWILHSSGSTGFPKPIFLTNLQCLANFRKSFGMRAFCTSPLFHSHGLMELFRAFYTRSPMYLGNYALPVTSHNLIQAMAVAKPELMCAVPYVLKLLAEKPEGVQALARAKLVLYGGSSCPDELGDRLVANGVFLVANYGATETGQIMTSFRPLNDTEWQYMRLHRPVADHALMDEIAPGVFECVGRDGLPSKGPSNSRPPYSEKNPENSFRTADLFTRHPDPAKSNFYKYLSRLDDRITLVNGEKVLPIPIEGRIRQEEIVREAVVFGFERTVPGVLIFRSSDLGLELSDEEFLEAVRPAIEAANVSAETFSRIPVDLAVIKGADVTYPRTDKGTFIRAQVYNEFAADIAQAYKRFESGGQANRGLKLDVPELEEWLLCKFQTDLGVRLPNSESDIFSSGVDSLQTTRIWRTIKHELDLGDREQELGQNVVFEKGTIKALAQHLYRLRTGEESTESDDEVEIMREMIEKYSRFTQHFVTLQHQPRQEVVVVTGATGNLGAFIVAELLKRADVAEVWALVRAPGQAAAGARLIQSLTSRHIDVTDDRSSKLRAVASDLSLPNLGLDIADLERLLSTATCVIHSAWAVNFNLGVRSFEAQHIRGTHNLLNLCLRSHMPSPARFFFCSSVSAASGTPKPAVIPESIVEDLYHAQKTGYGRSKLATEHIVRNAMRVPGMHARVLRIGQLSGDSASGIWNDTEAIALMIRSALTVGALPALDERSSWLPVDLCARIAVETALKKNTPTEDDADADVVYHLVNPQTFSWRDDLLPVLRQRTELPAFDIVSPPEWLRRLADSEHDVVKNPSVKLLDFWRGKYGGTHEQTAAKGGETERGLTFATMKTERQCPLLSMARDPVREGLMDRYVDVWLKKWRTA